MKVHATIVARPPARLKLLRYLVFEGGLAGTSFADPSCTRESVALVKAFARLIHLSDPEEDLAAVLAPRPVHDGVDERAPDALTAKAGVDPERRQRSGTAEPRPHADGAD